MNQIVLLIAGFLSSMTSAQITGRVLDSDNNPLRGTVVYDITGNRFEILNNETTLTEHVTRAICDKNGYFTLKSNSERPLLVARDFDGNYAISSYDQISGELLPFIFEKPADLTGIVMEGPYPKSNTEITVINQEYPRNFIYTFKTKTNQNGVFKIENMTPGSYEVMIFEDIPNLGLTKAVCTRQKSVSLLAGQNQRVQLGGHNLPFLTGKVTTVDNKPLHGVWVSLTPMQLNVDSETSVWGDITDPNGCYNIYDIPPGDYNLKCLRRLAKNTPTRVLNKQIQVQIKGRERMTTQLTRHFNAQQQILDIQIDIDPFMPLTVGQKAPDIESQTIEGKKWSLNQHRGKVIVVHFYTTKCKYCKPNFEGFEKIYNTLQPNVEVLGISLDKTLVECQDYINGLQVAHPQIYEGPASDISGQYRVTDVPTSFVVDKKGNIAQIDLFGETLVKFLEDVALIDN